MAYTGITTNPFTVPGAAAGYADFRKKASANGGAAGPVVTVAVPAYSGTGGNPKLAYPANIRQTNGTDTSATLSWDAVAHATAYQVRINGAVVQTVSSGTRYVATGLAADANGTKVGLEVKAIGDSTHDESDFAPVFVASTTGTNFNPIGANFWSNKSDVLLPNGDQEHDSFAYLTFDVYGSGSLTALLSAGSTNGNAVLLQDGQAVAVVSNNTPVQVTAGRYQLYEPGHAAGGSQYTTITNVQFGGAASAVLVPFQPLPAVTIIDGDSVTQSVGAELAGGWPFAYRRAFPNETVYQLGYSGKIGFTDFSTPSAINTWVANLSLRFTGATQQRLLYAVGLNDQYYKAALPLVWAAQLKRALLAMHVALPNLKVLLPLMYNTANSPSSPSQEEFRQAVRDAVHDLTHFVRTVEEKDMLIAPGSDLGDDALHPTAGGYVKLGNGLIAAVQNLVFAPYAFAGVIRADEVNLGHAGNFTVSPDGATMIAQGVAEYHFAVPNGTTVRLRDTYNMAKIGILVSIDGVDQATIDLSGSTQSPHIVGTFTTGTTANGFNSIRVSNVSTSTNPNPYFGFDGLELTDASGNAVALAALSNYSTYYYMTDTAHWTVVGFEGLGATNAYTSNGGGTATWTGPTNRLILLATLAPYNDDISVTLDTVKAPDITGQAAQQQNGVVVYDSGPLPYGTHTLVVGKANTKGGYISLQGLLGQG